jgi:hypothetical protein
MRRAACVLAVLALAGCGGGTKPLKPASPLPVVVLDAPSAGTWVRLLRSAGWSVHSGSLQTILTRTGAVVPGDARLSSSDVAQLKKWVRGGGRVATANDALLRALGIGKDAPRRLAGVRGAHWAKALTLAPLAGGGANTLLGTQRQGSGLVVALALDPAVSGQGWEYLPRAPQQIGSDLGAPVGPRAQSAEVFVDPGGLHDGIKDSPAKIADLLARGGTRIAEIAGWNYDFTDPRNNYDYGRLIDALHARGILAYAWLEPPFVTLALYQQHPECHEKTATGRDAVVDWRSLIALEDPHCMALAQQSWRRILTRYPWDGVNVAELYFEPDIKDANFTPFSPVALRLCGCDPRTQRDAFFAWRTREVTSLNAQVLRFVNSLPHAAHIGMELTVIDDRLDPDLGHQVGSDVAALARVAKENGASLVVEDPFTSWTEGPLRYDRLGPHVEHLMPPQASLIDVNVVPREGAKPTSQMQGAELGLALGSATASLGRLAIYSLGTLRPQDLDLLPLSMAAATSTTDLGVFGRWTVKVTAPSRSDGRLTVDGIRWPAANGVAVVPAGNHVLQWSAGAAVGPGLTAFGGELGTARVTAHSLTFTYSARPDAYAVVTQRPRALRIDGKVAQVDAVADPGGGYAVRVPTGTHRAALTF